MDERQKSRNSREEAKEGVWKNSGWPETSKTVNAEVDLFPHSSPYFGQDTT